MFSFLPLDPAANIHQLLVSDGLFKSSVQIFIYWTKLLPKLGRKKKTISALRRPPVKPSSVSNVLYRTFALFFPLESLHHQKASLHQFCESAAGGVSLWPSRPLTSLWMLCSSFTESFAEALGDADLPPEPPVLWLLWCSRAGLFSLLPGLEDSEPGLRPPCRPVDSRLEL